MKQRRYLYWGLLLGALSFSIACTMEQGSERPKSAEQPAPPNTPSVSVAKVIYQELTEWDEYTGRLQAPESVDLRPRVSGYVAEVSFHEGALVKAGDLLFKIDDRPYRAEVKRLQAQLRSRHSQRELAQSHYKRAQQLADDNAIADEVVDNRRANLEQAEAAIEAVSAALEIAQLNLDYTNVTSPIDGRVSSALATSGNYVNAGQNILTSIVSTDSVYAYFDADEQAYLNYAKLAREGSRPSSRDVKHPVYMALANDHDFPNEGYVDFIDNRIDPESGTIRGRAVFDNSEGKFIPGLFTRIRIIGSASYKGILIDDRAISTDLNNKFVLVLDAHNIVHYRPVELGEKLAGLRIIKSGLSPDDKIVVNGLQRVRSGNEVTPELVDMSSTSTLQTLQALQSRVDNSVNKSRVAGHFDKNGHDINPTNSGAVGG